MKGEWETGFTTPQRQLFHKLAIAYGGEFYGPTVERVTFTEQNFYLMMEALMAKPVVLKLLLAGIEESISRQAHKQRKEER